MTEVEDRLREHFRRQVERPDPNVSGRAGEVHERVKSRARRRSRTVVAAVVLVGSAGVAVAGTFGSGGESDVATTTDQAEQSDVPSDSEDTGANPDVGSGDAALWLLPDGASLGSQTTRFRATVFRLGCNSGKTGEVNAPVVAYEESKIVITFTVDSAAPGGGNCPANARKSYEVDLREPLGDRALVDGACLPAAPGEGTEDCLPDGVRQDPPPTQSQSSPGEPAPAPNAEVTERALTALTAAGVERTLATPGYEQEVNTAVEGTWRGFPVRAYVAPTDLAVAGELRRVGSRVVDGRQVEVLQVQDGGVQYYRFAVAGDTWLLASLNPGESQTDLERTDALTTSLLAGN